MTHYSIPRDFGDGGSGRPEIVLKSPKPKVPSLSGTVLTLSARLHLPEK